MTTKQGVDESAIVWNFRKLESTLADCYGIASSKRLTFASRLKNFHRLRFPIGFTMEPGKTARYQPGEVAMMALALEMTNLGLGPDRLVRVLALNWYPTSMALRMAASSLIERPSGFDNDVVQPATDPLSMFLFFDPSALSPLTFEDDPAIMPDIDDAADSFFYGGQGTVRENIVKWTSGPVSRISMINVTSMLDRIVGEPEGGFTNPEQQALHLAYRVRFFRGVVSWAEAMQTNFEPGGKIEAVRAFLATYFAFCAPPVADETSFTETVAATVSLTGQDPGFIRDQLCAFYEIERNDHVSP